jgi:hypothetical protein
VGFWGVFRDKVTEKIDGLSLLELLNREFQFPDVSKKIPVPFEPQKRLSTVNRAVCPAAPRVREAQNLRISLLNSLLAGKCGQRAACSRLQAPPNPIKN